MPVSVVLSFVRLVHPLVIFPITKTGASSAAQRPVIEALVSFNSNQSIRVLFHNSLLREYIKIIVANCEAFLK
jgi:hypothetical protein